jgi:hypothetical protein
MSHVEKCFYRSATFDPESTLPLYVLDTTFLPSSLLKSTASNDVENTKLNSFVDKLLAQLPSEDHALVILTNGFYQADASKDGSGIKVPLNIMRLLKQVPTDKKRFLRKIYIVHSSWLLKSLLEIFTKFITSASNKPTVINCENLTALAKVIDITKLPISLHTYMVDKVQYRNSKIVLSRHFPPLYGRPLTIYTLHNTTATESALPLTQFARIYNNLVAYLSNDNLDVTLTLDDWTTIVRCSGIPSETKITIDILSECLKREQCITLSDYSFLEHYMIIVKFVLKLSNSKCPLVPMEVLTAYSVDFEDVKQVDSFLNKVLLYRHPLLDPSGTHSQDQQSNIAADLDSYDNAYILIKLFKLFKFLATKLSREAHVLEPSAKNMTKCMERQSLRLVLAFTKILYTDIDSDDSLISTNDDDDIGFDNLFKLIRAVITHFDTLTILGTEYTLDDFNNHISFDDFLAFENFKNQKLGVQDVLESKIVHHKSNDDVTPTSISTPTSPVKPKCQLGDPPVVPLPRKTHLTSPPTLTLTTTSTTTSTPEPLVKSKTASNDSLNSHADSQLSLASSESYLPTSADVSIPMNKSEVDFVAESIENIGIENDDPSNLDLFTTPKRPARNAIQDLTPNPLVSPSPSFTSALAHIPTPTTPSVSITSANSKKMPPTIPKKLSTQSLSSIGHYSPGTTPSTPGVANQGFVKNVNLRKYTEKDLAVQQKAERVKLEVKKKEEQQKEVERGVRRGERKVSRLARLYEERIME